MGCQLKVYTHLRALCGGIFCFVVIDFQLLGSNKFVQGNLQALSMRYGTTLNSNTGAAEADYLRIIFFPYFICRFD